MRVLINTDKRKETMTDKTKKLESIEKMLSRKSNNKIAKLELEFIRGLKELEGRDIDMDHEFDDGLDDDEYEHLVASAVLWDLEILGQMAGDR
jgi:hypothetical protein